MIFRLLILGICLLVVGYYAMKNWAAIMQWFEELFSFTKQGKELEESETSIPVAKVVPPRPFATFQDPYRSDTDQREAMMVTFAAVQAYVGERGVRRTPDETPSEYQKRVAQQSPEIGQRTKPVIDAYNRLVYGGGDKPTQRENQAAASLWVWMKNVRESAS